MYRVSIELYKHEWKFASGNAVGTRAAGECFQQRALVLCLHRITQTRFLTNQRACFLRTVF